MQKEAEIFAYVQLNYSHDFNAIISAAFHGGLQVGQPSQSFIQRAHDDDHQSWVDLLVGLWLHIVDICNFTLPSSRWFAFLQHLTTGTITIFEA